MKYILGDVFENRHNEYGNVDVNFRLVESTNDGMKSFERKQKILHELSEELLV